MFIIVVGGGKIGYFLTKALLKEEHEVVIIERNAQKCDDMAKELGNAVVRGDGCDATTLADAGGGRAELLVAVTGSDEENLIACQVAKAQFRLPRTIALVHNPHHESIFKSLGVDVTVSGTSLILTYIAHELPRVSFLPLLHLKGGELEVAVVKIPADSRAAGKRLVDLSFPPGSTVFLVMSEGKKPEIPTGNTTLKAGDEVLVVINPEAEPALRAVLSGGG